MDKYENSADHLQDQFDFFHVFVTLPLKCEETEEKIWELKNKSQQFQGGDQPLVATL